jgi:metallo-beta-lactamase family protein
MKIQFLGAVREVTGSKHLITTDKGFKILLDCGMYQGKGLETDSMNRNLGFNPKEIDYLILSHAHIDHSGLIPFIYKLGFRGTILCTPATRDLCSIMLVDSGRIQEHDTKTNNKKRANQGLPPLDPIYTEEDAYHCMSCFVSIAYNKEFTIENNISVQFTDAGHILGSSAVNIKIKEGRKTHKICFTGDIGRYNKRILRQPDIFPQADYIIMESTYGNRLHNDLDTSDMELLKVVIDTCAKKKGKLIIPSFAIGRTQEIVHALDRLKNKNLLPDVDMYVDSPLAVSATNIFRLHPECFNEEILEYMKNDPDPFGFNNLHYVQSIDESKMLNHHTRPCVIISASGMMEAGRVKHHLANNIDNPKNTVLVVGYCAPSTLGAKIVRGDKEVSIFGHRYKVKADIERIESYSGHADYQEMLQFISCQNKTKLKKIFLVHGEFEVQNEFANYLNENGFIDVYIPDLKEVIEL